MSLFLKTSLILSAFNVSNNPIITNLKNWYFYNAEYQAAKKSFNNLPYYHQEKIVDCQIKDVKRYLDNYSHESIGRAKDIFYDGLEFCEKLNLTYFDFLQCNENFFNNSWEVRNVIEDAGFWFLSGGVSYCYQDYKNEEFNWNSVFVYEKCVDIKDDQEQIECMNREE